MPDRTERSGSAGIRSVLHLEIRPFTSLHTTSYPPLFGIVGDFETICGGGRCENCCDRLSVSSRRQIIALFMKRNSAVSGPTKISARQKWRDLRRTMGFACAFIVTAYARFSTKSATRSSGLRHAQPRL